jgi:hypothetical protein
MEQGQFESRLGSIKCIEFYYIQLSNVVEDQQTLVNGFYIG